MADTADTLVSVIREVTPGVTPTTTPAFKYLDFSDFNLNLDPANQITSDIVKANRAASDTVMTGYSVSGSASGELRRDTTLDWLIESGIGGAFASKVAKGGSTNFYQTFEQQMVTGAGSKAYFAYSGCQVSKLGFAVDASAKATWSADIVGMAQTQRTAIMSGATYAAATQGPLLSGAGNGSITIAGLTATFYSLDLQIVTNRSPKFALISQNAFGISTGGNRQITLTLQLYRDDISPEAVFLPNTPISVSTMIGSGAGNALTFSMARMFAKPPKRATNGDSEMVEVELVAAHDATAGTDITITQS